MRELITVGADACKHCRAQIGIEPSDGRVARTLYFAEKWAPVFGAPLSWLLAIAEKESSHDPSKINMRAIQKGGAWGLMQQMADEVPYKLDVIRRFYGQPSKPHWKKVRATMSKWRGRPRNLLDPDLNMMLAAWQIGRLSRVFEGDFQNAIAAYHQGESAVKSRIEKGLDPVSPNMQPKGYAYVAEVSDLRQKYIPLLIERLERRLPSAKPTIALR